MAKSGWNGGALHDVVVYFWVRQKKGLRRIYVSVQTLDREDLERNLVGSEQSLARTRPVGAEKRLATGWDCTPTEWYGKGLVCRWPLPSQTRRNVPVQTTKAMASSYHVMPTSDELALPSQEIFGHRRLARNCATKMAVLQPHVQARKIEGCITWEHVRTGIWCEQVASWA